MIYKKVSVVLGALALMVALGFGSIQASANTEENVCLDHKGKLITVDTASEETHRGHGDEDCE